MKTKTLIPTLSLMFISVGTYAAQPIMRVPFEAEPTQVIKNDTNEEPVIVNDASENQLNGEWVIYNVQGNKISGEEMPTINFQIAENRFYGNNGCNVINGGLKFTDNNGIEFVNPISTMRFCANDKYSHLVNATLGMVKKYRLSQYRHVQYVDLLNDKNQTVMILRNNNVSFLNGAWKVTELGNLDMTDSEVKLIIDIPQKHIHANAGCNIINGQIETNAAKPNAIQFVNLMSTRMLCPDMETETQFLIALEETEAAVSDADNCAVFYDNQGNIVMKMTRIPFSDLKK